MATLRIEHAISAFTTWKGAFDRFSAIRTKAGGRRHRICRPLDDSAYVMLNLDFDEGSAAEASLVVLRRDVWVSAQAAPALVGSPQTRIIETVESQES